MNVFLHIALAGVIGASTASACSFHNYAPRPTLVDRLLGSDGIVLARSAPEDPFTYAAIKALEGDIASFETPQLVDSVTRRRMLGDPETAVLFARVDGYGPWERVALIDASMAPVVSTVMERLPDWELGRDEDRFAYFAGLANHPDRRIRGLSLRELDQAEYSRLRSLPLNLDPSELLRSMQNPAEFDLRPIRILLLGLSGEPGLRDWLADGLNRNLRTSGMLTGAYATALIELEGASAVRDVVARYLLDPTVPAMERELLVEALALHAQRDEQGLQDTIASAIDTSLAADPTLAAAVARQFGARSEWSHHETLWALLQSGSVSGIENVLLITQYVSLARNAEDPAQN